MVVSAVRTNNTILIVGNLLRIGILLRPFRVQGRLGAIFLTLRGRPPISYAPERKSLLFIAAAIFRPAGDVLEAKAVAIARSFWGRGPGRAFLQKGPPRLLFKRLIGFATASALLDPSHCAAQMNGFVKVWVRLCHA